MREVKQTGPSGVAGDCWPTADQTLLLQAALLEGDAARLAFERWRSRAALDRLDSGSIRLLPLLYQRLLAQGAVDPLLPRLQQTYERAASRNSALLDAAAGAIRAFAAVGIDSVVLKGMALVVRGFVAPGARPMDDCDLLVPEAKALAARDTLIREGWRLLENMDADVLSVRHAVAFTSPLGHRLDLHWHVLADCCEGGADMDFWQAAEPVTVSGVATHTLCAADMVLHICVHGLRWSTVPPVRWAADAVTVIRSTAPLDWERVVGQAERRMLALPMMDALGYLQNALDVAVPAWVHARLSGVAVPREERAGYRVKMQRRRPHRLLLLHWFQHRRLSHAGTFLDLVRFPVYAKRRWGLRALARLVLRALRLARATSTP